MWYKSLFLLPAVLLLTSSIVRADDADDVKTAFTSFQAALKAADHEKMWPLLDKATQADAEKYAKMVQATYGKADDDEKAKLEKSFGLSPGDMNKITGKMYLKAKPFLAKHHELPGGKITKIDIDGDKATVS